ncbi:MAG: endolytic transglycosylase MltG, partial [Flavobacteriaceae bacterium]|nr:endolytic transglycosylase MltG [Flavobacteriaceae bacterium]
MNKRKILFSTIIIILLIVAFFSYQYYQKVFGASVTTSGFIYIKSDDSIEDVANSLARFIKDPEDFLWVAEKKKFKNIKGGKYEIPEGLSNNDLINLLRSGQQVPVQISFNNQDTLEKLAGRIASQIEADS